MSNMLLALIGGAFFGAWPLLMNRSGLSCNLSSAVFSAIVFLTVAPFMLNEGFGSMKTANMYYAVGSAIVGAIGLLAFNSMLSKAPKEQVGSFFIVMIMAQLALPAIYQMVMSGSLSPRKLVGITLAFVVAKLLV